MTTVNASTTSGVPSTRQLSQSSPGIFVALPAKRRRELLAQIDSSCRRLGYSRGGFVLAVLEYTISQQVADQLVATQQAQAAVAANAAMLGAALEPLKDAVLTLADSLDMCAHQRRAIGVHSNQIAKLANTIQLSGRHNDEDLVAMLAAIDRRLEQQRVAEQEHDRLRHDVLSLVDQVRAAVVGEV